MAKLNLKLKLKIIEKFKTQADFAEKLGIRDEILSRIVRGRRPLTDNEIKEWSQLLDVDVNSLIIGKPQTDPKICSTNS